ncbi:hypothetical protein O7635_22690 [Asanoa sp. WMMD1127]|uniref:hypothetical protein n=1 Tax=Asanoa sp. WMMD1127 TaxID=3016107 RepID=UPI0024164A51|nr:hypothetical protein [Asanoa sp. WMMD1127]MDG4824668.1 hypothetical protein [Asanoa sp. WMMD1127]
MTEAAVTGARPTASIRHRRTPAAPGASRFTVMDPSGNSIVFIQRDEPAELDYGGDLAMALAMLVELAVALGEPDADWRARLAGLTLTAEERDQVRAVVADPALLDRAV